MLTLSDSVEIDAKADRVWEWLCELPAHYTEWHPAHRSCNVIKGRLWEPSAIVEFEEDLHGRPHRLRCKLLSVIPGREITYGCGRLLHGRFAVTPIDGRTRFTAELSFGLRGLLGVLDPVLVRAFGARIAAVRQHQREEGANLKRLIESS